MSLDERDNDGGTWGIAMTAHGPLRMTHVQDDGGGGYLNLWGLKPLGNPDVIRRFIQEELDAVRLMTPGGVLPTVITCEVKDSPIPLVIPTSLPRETILTFQAAALSGTEALETAVRTVSDRSAIESARSYEEMWRANHPDASEREVREEMARHRQSTGTEDVAPATTRTALTNLRDQLGLGSSDEDIERAAAALDTSGEHTDASALTTTQQYAALATVLGSVAEVTVAAATQEGAGSEALQTTQRVLDVIAPICETIAVLTTSVPICAAVFEIIALVCRFISWLLDELAGYSISPQEGRDEEWSATDCAFILRERLRILVQCDEAVIDSKPTGWAAHWDAAMDARGYDEEDRRQILFGWIYDTAKNRGVARVGNAKAIAQTLGGRQATQSLNMCEDIRSWLLYVGVEEARVDIIYTWLYEARKVTVVRERREFLRNLRGSEPHGGPGYGVEYRGNMATYMGSNCKGGDHECRELGTASSGLCQLNFEYGSDYYYTRCQGINTGSGSEFVPFKLETFEEMYKQLAAELRVTALQAGSAKLEGGRFIPQGGEYEQEIVKSILYQLTRKTITTNKKGLAVYNGVPIVWFAMRNAYEVIPGNAASNRTIRSYFTALDRNTVAVVNLPNLRATPAGVYAGPLSLPPPMNRIADLIQQDKFKTAMWNAIRNQNTARGRTVFSAGTGSSGGSSTGLVLGVAAVATIVAAAVLVK